MRKNTAVFLILVLLLSTVAGYSIIHMHLQSDRTVVYDYAADLESVSGFDDVLRFAGGTDFSPFAYLDENGNPCGHDVELAFAIGRQLGCRVEITLGDWSEMQAGILDGTYDVLMTADYSDERSRIMGYTSPVCLDSYVFFGKGSGPDLGDLSILKQQRIAALNGGGATDNYLIPLDLLDKTTFYNTQIEAFEAVNRGDADVAIAGYIYGSNIIASLGMDLVQIGSPLYGSAYYFTYDIRDTELGPRLNGALAALEASGESSRIESKWTTHYQPSLTFAEYIEQNRTAVVSVCLIVVLLISAVFFTFILYRRRKEKEYLELDRLTGLYNMHAFLYYMAQILQKDNTRQYVLIRFDIDNFKAYNSSQGTEAGDILLQKIGEGLKLSRDELTNISLIGYMGADHFAILAEENLVRPSPELLVRHLKKMVDDSCPGYFLPVRMGICNIDRSTEDPAQYCDRALTAMRSIKNNYYRYWAIYDDDMRKQQAEEKEIKEKMHWALESGCFVPYFQPQYDYETGKICGAEALVRWVDPKQGIIPPSLFVPVFERNGFIYEMDKAVWKATCRYIRQWKQEGIDPPHVSVNISRADIFHNDLADTIRAIMQEEDVTFEELHLEITESAYQENTRLLQNAVERFHEMGAHVEMDDFGSGYSSLGSLKDLACDTLKIDMSLVRDNSLSGRDSVILSNVVKLGLELGMNLIAEGVEQEQQAQYLHSIGCRVMQGYLYSKPVPAHAFEAMLRKEQTQDRKQS